MEKVQLTISIKKANIFALVLYLATAIIFFIPFFAIWGIKVPSENSIWVFAMIIVGIPVHELIHGITWACFAPSGWKSISFGIIWNMLTPYCHCKEPMKVNQYICGALMPLLILGIIPLIISFFIGSIGALFFGWLFIGAAGGDIMCCWILRHENKDSLVEDHQSEAGCWVYRNTENTETNTNN